MTHCKLYSQFIMFQEMPDWSCTCDAADKSLKEMQECEFYSGTCLCESYVSSHMCANEKAVSSAKSEFLLMKKLEEL